MIAKLVAAAGAASLLAAGLGQVAVAEEAAPADPQCVESHIFSGASSSIPDFENWIAGKDFVFNPMQTRDLSEFELPNGDTVYGGDTVCKSVDGLFSVKQQ